MLRRHLFTSESVTEGHPDKVADQISDAVVDALLAKDPASRVACETMVTTGLATIFGEITTEAYVHLPALVRETIARIGYTEAGYGFDAHTCAVMSTIDQQSKDIAMGVDTGGAGDQGMMFGFACDETEELMPLPITLAHRLTRALADRRKDGTLPWLRPDGKSQVSVLYENGRPVHVDTVVISTQHSDTVNNKTITESVKREIIDATIPKKMFAREVDDPDAYQPNGPLRDRRSAGRRRIDGPQNYRRHLRRDGPARRRGVQRQGSVEGRPLGFVRGALGCEEYRRREARDQLRSAGRLRDWRRETGFRARTIRSVGDRNTRLRSRGRLPMTINVGE